MITKEFRRWVEDIKDLVEKRIGKLGYVWMSNSRPHVFDVGIEFLEGQGFWMSFDQEEFNHNNKNQRRKLAKIRREDLASQIEDFAKKVAKVAKKLQ